MNFSLSFSEITLPHHTSARPQLSPSRRKTHSAQKARLRLSLLFGPALPSRTQVYPAEWSRRAGSRTGAQRQQQDHSHGIHCNTAMQSVQQREGTSLVTEYPMCVRRFYVKLTNLGNDNTHLWVNHLIEMEYNTRPMQKRCRIISVTELPHDWSEMATLITALIRGAARARNVTENRDFNTTPQAEQRPHCATMHRLSLYKLPATASRSNRFGTSKQSCCSFSMVDTKQSPEVSYCIYFL